MHCSLCRLAIFDHFHISYNTGVAWMTPPALSLDMQPCCDNSTGATYRIGSLVVIISALYIPVGVMYACMHAAIILTRHKNFCSLGVITSVLYTGGEGRGCMAA